MSDVNPGSTTGMFASLSNRAYALLWWSGLVAFLAVGMQILARGWLAIELTDSNSSFALVLGAFGIGMVTVTPFGGVAADRFPRRALILGSHVSLTLSALWLGIMVVLGLEEFWMLLVASVIQGSSFAFMGPARIAMTGEVVERELLSNAISLTQLTVASTQSVGPFVAGVLADTPNFGLAGVYLLSAGLTTVGAIPVLMLPSSRPQQREARSPVEEIAEGVGYVARNPYLRVVVISTALMLLVAMPYQAFLPKYTESVFGVGVLWLGVLQGANALGGTVTALQVARMRDNTQLWRLRVISLTVVAAGVAVLAITPNQWAALPVLFVLGGAATTFQTANMSMSLLLAEPVYHGRVQSLVMIAFSAQSLVAFPMGVLADQIGLREMHGYMAAATVLVVVWSVLAGRQARRQTQASAGRRVAR
ncbi:MFS transporter [Candidatus Poriferisocius sp.]|uniref:MFS transporter n=1 Tax=Candidatus Poriferisocius sp. TaxID=3101276 RepID=UPI003B591D9C